MEKREFKVGDIVIGKQQNIKAIFGTVYPIFTPSHKRAIAEIKEDKIRLQWDTDLWFYAKDFKLETMEKEIIGYKLIKPEYRKAASMICFGDSNWIPKSDNNTICSDRNHIIKNLKEAKVLDIWFEPVYEEEKQIITMHSSNKGNFEIEVINGEAWYKPDNKLLPKEWIRDIINSFGEIIIPFLKGDKNPYNVTISSLNVGCYHNCKKEDWEKVYKLLK